MKALLLIMFLAGAFDAPITNPPLKKDLQAQEDMVGVLIYIINFNNRCKDVIDINQEELRKVARELNDTANPTEDMITHQYVEEIKTQNIFMEKHHIGREQWCYLQKFVLTAEGYEKFFK